MYNAHCTLHLAPCQKHLQSQTLNKEFISYCSFSIMIHCMLKICGIFPSNKLKACYNVTLHWYFYFFLSHQSSTMKKHKMVHTDHKPFACMDCGHSCKTAQDLVKHLRQHTGEKPFKCRHCEKVLRVEFFHYMYWYITTSKLCTSCKTMCYSC